jgi:hypothetical protein
MQGTDDGETSVEDRLPHRAMDGFGAFIVGCHVFGSVRGDWPDES